MHGGEIMLKKKSDKRKKNRSGSHTEIFLTKYCNGEKKKRIY